MALAASFPWEAMNWEREDRSACRGPGQRCAGTSQHLLSQGMIWGEEDKPALSPQVAGPWEGAQRGASWEGLRPRCWLLPLEAPTSAPHGLACSIRGPYLGSSQRVPDTGRALRTAPHEAADPLRHTGHRDGEHGKEGRAGGGREGRGPRW